MKSTLARPALAVLAVALLAACAGSSATWTYAPPTPSPTPGPATPEPTGRASAAPTVSPAPSAAPGSPAPSTSAGRVIALEETGALTIMANGKQVTSLSVTKGETIHFEITNTAGFPHNFTIGTADQLSQNLVSGLPGTGDFSEGTARFDYVVTDKTAGFQFGCSLQGHYPSMHGTFKLAP